MNHTAPGFDFRPQPPPPNTEAWRDIDRAVARWVRAHGGPAALACAAGWASYADGQGDTALMLDAAHAARLGINAIGPLHDDIHALADDASQRWLARIDPATDTQPETPFLLEGDAFYLRRNYRQEVAVADLLRARLSHPESATAPDEATLRLLFGDQDLPAQVAQRDAVRQVVGQRLFVLTGSPGTGKTTTVLRMLLALSHAWQAQHERVPQVRLAAPTGKAAQRLGESLRHGADQLRSSLPSSWQEHLATALTTTPGTLHRLLGSRGRHGQFTHHARHRLPADIVVVDEASMIDLALLRALLDALPQNTLLVLVGDAEQLAPVGTGSALADLCLALEGGPSLVRLQHSFRAERELVDVFDAIREGDIVAFDAAWERAGTRARRYPLPDQRALPGLLSQWTHRLHDSLAQTGAFDLHPADDSAALQHTLAALKRQQLLCALREGMFGAHSASAWIERALRRYPSLAGWSAPVWYPGRAVIVLRNDAASGLYNGDVGLCLRLRDAQGNERLAVVFDPAPDPDADSTPAPRCFDPHTLPAHETAFALTVHKSQGSEYEHVAVLLPPLDDHPLLVRQMLHTGLSRARSGMELWAQPETLAACLQTPLQRAGRLAARLQHSD